MHGLVKFNASMNDDFELAWVWYVTSYKLKWLDKLHSLEMVLIMIEIDVGWVEFIYETIISMGMVKLRPFNQPLKSYVSLKMYGNGSLVVCCKCHDFTPWILQHQAISLQCPIWCHDIDSVMFENFINWSLGWEVGFYFQDSAVKFSCLTDNCGSWKLKCSGNGATLMTRGSKNLEIFLQETPKQLHGVSSFSCQSVKTNRLEGWFTTDFKQRRERKQLVSSVDRGRWRRVQREPTSSCTGKIWGVDWGRKKEGRWRIVEVGPEKK